MKMKQSRKIHFAALLFIAIVLSSAVNSFAGEPYKTRLENGMTAIIEEVPSSPAVAVQMWVKVGGADERDENAGISHIFEHMLFKGTKKRRVGELARAVESVGGDINAYTSFDNTVYHVLVPSRHFLTGLDVISDAIQNSSFDPEELKKELQVVLEEIRMNEDDPERNLYKATMAEAYLTHPYKRPVIGYKKIVEAVKREDMIRHFNKWYVPNNMTLVVAGGVKKEAALDAIRKAFAGFKKSKDPHRQRPVEPKQDGLRTRLLSANINESHLSLAFHIPDIRHTDSYGIDFIAEILGSGESSRLYKRLKTDEHTVHEISAYAMSLKEPGLFFITATLDAQNIEKAVKDIGGELVRLAASGPDPAEMERALRGLESGFIYSRETVQGIAGKLGYYEVSAGGIEYEKKYLDGIRAVTAADVRTMAGKYLNRLNMTAVTLVPEKNKEAVTSETLAKAIGSMALETPAAAKSEADEAGKVTKIRLENGITLLVKEARTNPTVAFYAAFPGGLRFETPLTSGIGNLTAQMLTMGTKKRTREDIAAEVEGMAGNINGFSGWNTTGVSGKFLSRDFDKALAILSDVLMNPVFPEEELEKSRKDIIASIKSMEDNLPYYTFRLLYRTHFKTHPYGLPVSGTVETVSAFKREDVTNHYERVFIPERMVLTIVGDVDAAYALKKAKEAFKGFSAKAPQFVEPLPEERTKEIRAAGEVKEKSQTNIGIGFNGAPIGGAGSYALKVLSEILSAQGGRLFVNLRDKRSLAYALSTFSREGVGQGFFGVYIGTAPHKKDAAISGIFDELKAITTEKPTDEELTRAKNSLIGGYELGLQDIAAQASDMANNELLGLGYDYRKTWVNRIEAVTAEAVLKAGQKYLTLDSYTISTVGPKSTGQ
ncbi:MAG: insulinase family protein [Deltaproteobacteria bacterium]|nr:insulinase family protein [Deltaproteobacteria bacterium]